MVEAIQESESDFPTILIVTTPATAASREKIIDALKLKQGDTVDQEQKIWEIITNYYKAKVRLEMFELPLVASHLLDSSADQEEGNAEWNALFEKNI